MNRNEILEKSRSEHNSEYEKHIYDSAGSIAYILGGLACAVLLLVEEIVADHYNSGCWLIFCVMRVAYDIYIFIRTRSKRNLFTAVIMAIIGVVMAYLYFTELFQR